MSTKRSVVLKGCPQVTEEGAASAEVRPGYLVKGVGTIAHQTSTTKVPKTFALERDELGAGIDNSLQGSGTGSAYYASGDRVKVGAFYAGCEVTAFIASGQNISEDDLLESAGNGTLTEGSTNPIARAMEALSPVASVQPLRVQIL